MQKRKLLYCALFAGISLINYKACTFRALDIFSLRMHKYINSQAHAHRHIMIQVVDIGEILSVQDYHNRK